jgi:Flp pilus assembly secretin CpaC
MRELDMVIRAFFALFMAAMAVAPAAAQTQVVGSDEMARFVPLELGKSIVIDLPDVVADVVVAKPAIANVIMRNNTRAYVVATDVGDTSIYFFDVQRRRIEGFDIMVLPYPVQAPSPSEPKVVVTVVRGSQFLSLNCTRTTSFSDGAKCYEENPKK